MTDTTIVLQKLTTLREHLARVTRRRPANAAALRGDVDLQDALALSLLVAIQKAVDSAFHITADEGWGVVRMFGSFLLGARSRRGRA